jgi:hypothetical protein
MNWGVPVGASRNTVLYQAKGIRRVQVTVSLGERILVKLATVQVFMAEAHHKPMKL